MGIPKYFSFIIKNYPNIIKNLDFFNEDGNKIHTLFLDSNSIIYDCVHKLDQSNYNSTSIFEDKIDILTISPIDALKVLLIFTEIKFSSIFTVTMVASPKSSIEKNGPLIFPEIPLIILPSSARNPSLYFPFL